MISCFSYAPICGVSVNDFWQLTPFAFGAILETHNKKALNDFDLVKYQTWHTAAFMRSKTMPRYDKYIKPLLKTAHSGINEDAIKAVLKAHQNGQSRKS